MRAIVRVMLALILMVGLVVMIEEDATAQGTGTFYFYDDTTPMTYMMYRTLPTGTTTSANNVSVSFYSATFPAGASIGAGTATVYLWAQNTTGANKTLSLTLVAGSTTIGSGSITITPKTTPTLFNSSFSYSTHTFSEGERLQLGIGKENVTLYWDGQYNDSRLVIENLTVVTLSYFTAVGCDGYVLLEWETASEIDNAGFNLWRGETEAGSYTQINAHLIPARGSPISGASYSYLDESVSNGVTYWYKLEDVDLHGVSTFHGPVSATPQRLYQIYLPLLSKGSAS